MLSAARINAARLSSRIAPSVRALSSGSGDYDLVVVGGGPGGYVAAIKASQLGLKVRNYHDLTCFLLVRFV